MTTASLRLERFKAFLKLEAKRDQNEFVRYVGMSLVEWGDKDQHGQLPHLTHCSKYAENNLFAFAEGCSSALKHFSGGSIEFEAMEYTLVGHAKMHGGVIKSLLWGDQAPTFEGYGLAVQLNLAADYMLAGQMEELGLWLDKERLDYKEPAEAEGIKPSPTGRPPAAWWDDLWADTASRLYLGDLKPVRQADIEKAISEWAASRGGEVSESSVRERARKLWVAISKEDKHS